MFDRTRSTAHGMWPWWDVRLGVGCAPPAEPGTRDSNGSARSQVARLLAAHAQIGHGTYNHTSRRQGTFVLRSSHINNSIAVPAHAVTLSRLSRSQHCVHGCDPTPPLLRNRSTHTQMSSALAWLRIRAPLGCYAESRPALKLIRLTTIQQSKACTARNACVSPTPGRAGTW